MILHNKDGIFYSQKLAEMYEIFKKKLEFQFKNWWTNAKTLLTFRKNLETTHEMLENLETRLEAKEVFKRK